ncbi:beta-propeller fold lactonase family protein [candidate division KSB1 bacterium]|nr:beta-propeller fold lactonase family protein [candidate division KSB1 bacterium]NIR68916.1 beta-propeller fold lactonase family protein [candidate division KSB1 bacterium]NIS27264.1 beta-propeller fold lactonase family protein [candidate division KSB1 bacterium]NIT74149.1 beta-propeller fold lactonase family protein [candidate division KSB1 bacterium]NIU27998.1 beta-propeller fold lactonase family protein [candidate division KSB1 bacterium]
MFHNYFSPILRFLICFVFFNVFLGLSFTQTTTQTTGTLIVLNKSEASASLISLSSGKIVATIHTGQGPHEVDVSSDGKIAVVSNYGIRREPGSTLSVIDLQSLQVTETIDLKKYQRPHGVMFLPNGESLLVTAESQKTLLVVNVKIGKIAQAIETGQNVSHMVVHDPERNRAFVSNIGSGSVTVIDLQTSEAVGTIETGAGAEGIDISPTGKEVWVSNRADDTISIIDTKTLEVVETVECSAFPIRLKFTPDGKFVLVSNARSGDVAVFDAKERTEIKRISMKMAAVEGKEERLFSDRFGESPVPVGILVHPNGDAAYVANTNADIVTVIEIESWQISNRLPTGKEPDGLGYSPLEIQGQVVK